MVSFAASTDTARCRTLSGDGQLLLFHRSAEHHGRKRWEKTVRSGAMTEREPIKRAQSNFINIKF
jgi:hypothetical protein